jgi:hypothetical protein
MGALSLALKPAGEVIPEHGLVSVNKTPLTV